MKKPDLSLYPTTKETEDKIPRELPKGFMSKQEIVHHYLWAHFCMTNRGMSFKCRLDWTADRYLLGIKTPWGCMTQYMTDSCIRYDDVDVPEKVYDPLYTDPHILEISVPGLRGMVLHEEFPSTNLSAIQEYIHSLNGRGRK